MDGQEIAPITAPPEVSGFALMSYIFYSAVALWSAGALLITAVYFGLVFIGIAILSVVNLFRPSTKRAGPPMMTYTRRKRSALMDENQRVEINLAASVADAIDHNKYLTGMKID